MRHLARHQFRREEKQKEVRRMQANHEESFIIEKRSVLKDRLARARNQVEIMERLVSIGRSIDKNAFHSARSEFNVAIPNGSDLFGCSSSCSLFCKCSYHLFKPELDERHLLYMRYFDAKETAGELMTEVEQTSFALPGVKQRIEVQKRKQKTAQLPASEAAQLGIIF